MNERIDVQRELVDGLAAAALRDGLSLNERVSRLDVLRGALHGLGGLAAADPYRPGTGFSIVADTLAAATAERRHGTDTAAVERLHRHGAVVALTAAVAPQTLADTAGLTTVGPAGRPVGAGLPGSPLLDLADPFTPSGPSIDIPLGWNPLPAAVIDPAEKTAISSAVHTGIASANKPWHLAAYALNLSKQVLDWGEDSLRRYQDLITATVNSGLEKTLITDLLAAAGTAAADVDAAEAAAGTAWGTAVDTLVVNPGDWPKVRRSYAPQPVPFANVAVTAGITAGTALLFARAAVTLLAEQLQWGTVVEPAYLGQAVAASRAGIAVPLRTGAVAAATITP